MTEPTYHVVTEHKPANGEAVRWLAKVYLLTQPDVILWDTFGRSEAEVVRAAESHMAARNITPDPGSSWYYDENGVRIKVHVRARVRP